MRLPEIVWTTLSGVTARLRRDAIAYGVCALCAVVAVVLAISASVLALEPLVGMVYARLIVAAAFVLIAVGAIVWLKFANTQPAPRAAVRTRPVRTRTETAEMNTPPQDKLAMIVEAVMLGYSMSRRPDGAESRRRH
jgi:hypothetical protein